MARDMGAKGRYKKITISNIIMVDMLQGKLKPYKTNLPPGTIIRRVTDGAHYGDRFDVVIEHESFPEVEKGLEIPEFELLLETL